VPPGVDVALLLLRAGVGVIMFAHGTQKLFGWFDGSGLDATGQFLSGSGYPAGRAMAVVTGLAETLGGVGLALGLLTPLAAAAVLGVMINAMAVKWGGGFFAPDGIEYEILLALAAVALALTGPGRYAVDRLLPLPALPGGRPAAGPAALALGAVAAVIILLIRS